MTMDEKLWHSHKVYNYTFNFMAMSCLLGLIVLWHLSETSKLFLVTCVHYNYKWVTNSVINFQISFNECPSFKHLFVFQTIASSCIPSKVFYFDFSSFLCLWKKEDGCVCGNMKKMKGVERGRMCVCVCEKLG
jgi:hypothetical protein